MPPRKKVQIGGGQPYEKVMKDLKDKIAELLSDKAKYDVKLNECIYLFHELFKALPSSIAENQQQSTISNRSEILTRVEVSSNKISFTNSNHSFFIEFYPDYKICSSSNRGDGKVAYYLLEAFEFGENDNKYSFKEISSWEFSNYMRNEKGNDDTKTIRYIEATQSMNIEYTKDGFILSGIPDRNALQGGTLAKRKTVKVKKNH